MKRFFSTLIIFLTTILALPAQAAVILQYHHIDKNTPASTSTTPELFAEHMKWLNDNGFQVVPLTVITDKLKRQEPLPDKTVAITFDDAYVSIYKNALPVMEAYNFPFTIFINTQAVDQRHQHTLTWKQLNELGKKGATLANHTVYHDHVVERLPNEQQAEWVKRIKDELQMAEERIKEQTGQSHKLIAWPFGETAPELEQMIRENGYIGFGQQSGAVGLLSNPAKLPRYPLGAGYGAMKNFPLKMQSLPLPVTDVQPASDIAPQNGIIGPITLKLAKGEWVISQVACYALGRTLDIAWQNKEKTELEVVMPDQLPLGRSRVNCTAPGPEGRWFWFSKDWVRLTKDGKAID
ncbi:polysaccharide deacetylase family protein [Sansalvadorimonas verongulae]|uniref:polysaccharide deacetylase family protein n=1 Tax=Sansalvadorimonas verongulae TaxID=2172824 RepID=UPI0018AD2A0D|nr:polysaccharide deacetylase family protein [Sansalvadorimonas verongulae]